jgi:hypothetical protein
MNQSTGNMDDNIDRYIYVYDDIDDDDDGQGDMSAR